MNVVVWSAKGNLYATAAEQIVEVIPLVEARPQPRAPDWVRGLIDYRGRLIPLLDMSVLLGHARCENRMSTRILVVRTDDSKPSNPALRGLLVEELLGSNHFDFADGSSHAGIITDESSFLGPVALTGTVTVQLTEASRIPLPGT